MRCVCLVLAALIVGGCSPAATRTPPRTSWLVARAWARREPPSTSQAWTAVAFANAQVGKRYCWGGVGPSCFDCSGLVRQAWGAVGARLPHSSEAIADALREVPLDEVRAGDILWWPGHVAIYAGNGWAIEALDSHDGVVLRPTRDPRRAFRPGARLPGG
jgi:cell wall-associated NlpC family hydrolase